MLRKVRSTRFLPTGSSKRSCDQHAKQSDACRFGHKRFLLEACCKRVILAHIEGENVIGVSRYVSLREVIVVGRQQKMIAIGQVRTEGVSFDFVGQSVNSIHRTED